MIASFFQSSMDENGKKRSYYAVYTFLFCVVAFFCFSWFIFSGKSLIWKGDGWKQHFKALIFYAKYLRQIIRHLLFDHKLIIPDYDFSIGEGSDIVNALHYYVIGDPITLLCVFVRAQYMQYFYTFTCVLRLYLAGWAFSELCFSTGRKNRYGILAGSIAYTFCYWALYNVARHPYFLNPMIYFPIMILGMERIIQKKSPYLFIAITAISAASNFYYFYIIVILTVIYAFIRLGVYYRLQIKQGFLTLLYLGAMAIIGVCIAGIILFPVLMMFLQDSRLSMPQPFHWFYPISYYSMIPSIAISDGLDYWLVMGFSAPVILSLFLLFQKKKNNTLLKLLFGTMVAIMVFPIGGRILNGMSYMTNRWSWAFALLCAYILVVEWDNLFLLTKKQWKSMTIFSISYYIVCLLFEKSRRDSALAALPMFFIALLIIQADQTRSRANILRQIGLLSLVAVGSVHVAFWKYSPTTGNYIAQFEENKMVWNDWYNNEVSVVKSLSDSPNSRMSGRSLTPNGNIAIGFSSTQYYWSISNPYMNEFRSSLFMREQSTFEYDGYDDRTTLLALSAVQYYSVKNNDSKGIPYGYTFIEKKNADITRKERIEELKTELDVDDLSDAQSRKISGSSTNNYSVFQNDYALPIAYCYSTYFTKEMWDSFNPVQKQEAQLDAAYVDAKLEDIPIAELNLPSYLAPYDIECSGIEVSQGNHCFITTANNAKIILTLHDNITNAETYVGFTGLEFFPTAEYDLYFGDDSVDPLKLYNYTNWEMLPHNSKSSISRGKFFWNPIQNVDITIETSAGTKKVITYKQPDSTWSSGRHDFIANLGYVEDVVSTITITFPLRGKYSFDSLDVYGIPMDEFAGKIEKLQADTLQDIQFGTDTLSGRITLSESKLLCFATPFSNGWKASIDGKDTKVYCLNERYPGIVVPAGEHSILFHYHMPYKKAGFGLSLLGLASFALLIIISENKKKKEKNVGTSE